MIKLYYADISRLNEEAFINNLSAYRLEKHYRLKNEIKRKQGIGAELLLNMAAEEFCPGISLPLNISADINGKPECAQLPFYFNISHSGNYSACAVSDRKIGLDIQKLSPFNEKTAMRCFTRSELEYIMNSACRDRAFTEIWARKESVLKAAGQGLRLPMASFSVIAKDGTVAIEKETFRIQSGECEDFCFSVCLSGNESFDTVISKNCLLEI